MPFGYQSMILIALIPPLWFLVIHPILDDYQAKSQAQIQAQVQALSPVE